MEEFILFCEIICKFILPLVLMSSVLLSYLFKPLPQSWVKKSTSYLMSLNVASSTVMLFFYFLYNDKSVVTTTFGRWYVFHNVEAPFTISYDALAVVFSFASTWLIAIAGNFSAKYLNGDKSYNRFFGLYAMFYLGVNLLVLSRTLDLAFAGWELLGLSSALLVAFYFKRKAAVSNGMYLFTIYKIGDLFFLTAIFALHYLFKTSDLSLINMQMESFPIEWGLFIGGCLVVAAAAKSAQLPFLGWLARAMDGPTPSSAIFYGAVSVHAGCFMLIKLANILEQSFVIRLLLIVLGAATAVIALLMARVRSDVKTQLAYATLVQVSLIFVEIGLGLYSLAMWHMIGHMTLRTFQLLTSPAFLQHASQIGFSLRRPLPHWSAERLLPRSWQVVLYRMAFHGFYIEAALLRLVAILQQTLERFAKFDQAFWGREVQPLSVGQPAKTSTAHHKHVPADYLLEQTGYISRQRTDAAVVTAERAGSSISKHLKQ